MDLIGKAAGVPVYRLWGGEGERMAIPIAAYFFFRGKDRQGEQIIASHQQGPIYWYGAFEE